jgi:hypothetical protein
VGAERLTVPRMPGGPAVASLAALALAAVLASAGCGSDRATGSGSGSRQASGLRSRIPAALASEARPIGVGARFHPPVAGPPLGACRSTLGTRIGVHVEVFAENRVVLLPAGIGARLPLRHSEGRISGARCFGELTTLEPTGVVLIRPGGALTVAALFRSWGQPLSARRLAGFTAPHGARVAAFVDGRRWPGSPSSIPLARHSEIVLEVGPHVPPHASYRFAPGS